MKKLYKNNTEIIKTNQWEQPTWSLTRYNMEST